MTRSWKRGRKLETRLRAGRTAPSPELITTIAAHVRPGRPIARSRRRPFGLAGLVTALVLTPVIALGGGSAALGTVSDQLKLRPAQNQIIAAPAQSQYGNRVNTCLLGRVQVRLPRRVADILVTLGVARLGSCSPTLVARTAALKIEPLTSVCVLTKLQTSLPRRIATRMIELGVARTRPCEAVRSSRTS